MKIDKLNLSRALCLTFLMTLTSSVFAENEANPVQDVIVVLQHCILTFSGDHAKRSFQSYMEIIIKIVIENREPFLNATDISKLPKHLTTKEDYLDEFIVKLNQMKTCKKWDVIQKTLEMYTAAIPALGDAFKDYWGPIGKAKLYRGITRRITIPHDEQ